jgi:hypothetical protein
LKSYQNLAEGMKEKNGQLIVANCELLKTVDALEQIKVRPSRPLGSQTIRRSRTPEGGLGWAGVAEMPPWGWEVLHEEELEKSSLTLEEMVKNHAAALGKSEFEVKAITDKATPDPTRRETRRERETGLTSSS